MKRLIKILILFVIFSTANIGLTNSYFSSKASVEGNRVSAGCWVPPSVPVLSQPADNSFVNALWDANPKFDWQDSSINCSLSSTVEYQFEVYEDAGITVLYYRSGWLSNSEISLPAMPDGDYYWRVKSRDEFGNESSFSSLWKLTIDRVAPVISNVSHSINSPGAPNQKKATVSWVTDELATSNLRWRIDPDPSWTALVVDPTADKTHHSRDIDGLLPETTYYVEVESTDSAGNSATAFYSFGTSGERSEAPWADQVVLNEFLPNPSGDDDALMPNGEWVEVYNKSDTVTFDLSGWYLTDADGGHKLYMTLINTITFDPSTFGLNIGPHEFFVIYRNGDSGFELDNDFGGDEVNLYSSTDELADQHSYSIAFGDEVLENKSIARYPDGTDNWFDPVPTAGRPNQLEPIPTATPTIAEKCTPKLDFSYQEQKRVSFTVSCAIDYSKASYELVYEGPFGEKGIVGSVDNVPPSEKIEKSGIKLGTCSSLGEVCLYDEGVKKIRLKVTLHDSSGGSFNLEKEQSY